MTPFLAAQARDPLNPAPMLIQADRLEEHGDATGAAVLRGLVARGTPSLHALALRATLHTALGGSYKAGNGSGDGFGEKDGFGFGDTDWFGYREGEGEGLWFRDRDGEVEVDSDGNDHDG